MLPSHNMQKNLAMGHNGGAEVENWDIPTLAGAGAIRSTAVDMVKYLQANMGITKSKLYPNMQLPIKTPGQREVNRLSDWAGILWSLMS